MARRRHQLGEENFQNGDIRAVDLAAPPPQRTIVKSPGAKVEINKKSS